MKRKSVSILLAAVMAATLFTGCGKKEEPTQEAVVEEVTEEETEEPEEQEPEYETVAYSVVVASENEDGTYTAYDADNTYILTLADELPEDQRAKVAVGAAISVSTEVEKEAENEEAEVTDSESEPETESEEETTPVPIQVTAVADISEEEAADLTYATFEKINGFSVEEMTDTPMYANQTVNVRKGPSADYEQLGSLSWGDEVTVTGIASTGWYQIRYNDETGYCSNNYIVNDKPVKKQTQTASAGSSASASTGNSGSSAAASTDMQGALNAMMSMGYSEEQARAMIESQFGAGSSAGATASASSGSSSDSGASTAEKTTSTCPALADAINAGRAEEGVDALTWDDSLAAIAKERAEAITSDLSHNGSQTLEMLTKSQSSDVQTWYNNFYNSGTHRKDMMGKTKTKIGAAYCYYNGSYYVIVTFGR